jgi:hypothetical protein
MMKTYMGIPGDPPTVMVTEGAVTAPLAPGAVPYGWGKLSPGGASLAKAILLDHLQDEYRALQLHGRFKWRTVAVWNAAEPWTLTSAQIGQHLKAIEENEPAIAQARVEAQRAPAPIAREGGLGVDGAPIPKITVDGREQ